MGDGEPEHLGDGAIIAASRREPERFGRIFDRHADAVHGYLWRRAGASAADELLGDARFQFERASARPWLYGIATNQLQHWWRSRARAAPVPGRRHERLTARSSRSLPRREPRRDAPRDR